MTTLPITFVLGAGASADVGFPLGRSLLLSISKQVRDTSTSMFHWLRECGCAPDQLERFGVELEKSLLPSVDAFLESRPEYLELGKLAIACALIPYEDENILMQRNPNQIRWYEHLLAKFMTASPNEATVDSLRFITFNYDRSLEHAILCALMNAYGWTQSVAASNTAKLSVIHVYGQIGDHPAYRGAGRPYRTELSLKDIRLASAGIKIIHEGENNKRHLESAREKIKESGTICFLGFGYHPDNVKRLGISDLKEGQRRIFGTAYAMGNAEREAVSRLIPGGIELGHRSHGCLEMLKEFPILPF